MTSKQDDSEEKGPIKDIYELLIWLYTLTATWRIDESRKIDRIIYNCYKVLTYISYMWHIILLSIGTAYLYQNFQMFSFGLTFFILAAVGLTKMILLEFQIDKLKNLEDRLENDLYLPWMGINEWEKIVKKKNANFLKNIVKVLFVSAGIGSTITMFLPMFPNSKLIFVVPTPLNHLSNTSLFIPIYIHQTFSLTIFVLNFIVYDLIFVGIVLRLCNHLEIIKLNLNQIEILMPIKLNMIQRESGLESIEFLRKFEKNHYYEDEMDKKQKNHWFEKYTRIIKNCIAHHQAVLREIKLVGNIFSYTIFVYVFCGPFLMGLLTYVILSGTRTLEISIQQASFVIPTGLFLFMQCYFGTRLTTNCEDVRFALYDCPWYEMDIRTRKLILGAMIAMEKTGQFKAGNIVVVSLKTFLTTIQTTYNIVAFLKNTT